MKILYEAKASATGGRNGHVKSADGVLDLQLSIPKGLGGPGGAAPNPEMLFAAGYSACFDSALAYVAGVKKIKPTSTRVDATVGIGAREGGGFGLAVKLEVAIEGLDRAVAQDLLESAHQVCPYSNATRNNIAVELVLL